MRAIVQRQRAGCDQRGVFAQTVAGQARGDGAALLLPQAPHRDARRQQGRLGVFGAAQHFFRPALGERPQIGAGTVGSFIEGVAYLRVQFGQFGQHAQGLRPLAGKHEGECGVGHAREDLSCRNERR